MSPENSSYQPIFFDAEWTLYKYYGWKLVEQTSTYQLLQQQMGPFKKWLVLGASDNPETAGLLWQKHKSPFSMMIWKPKSEQSLLPKGFQICEDSQRLLNTKTIVIDLKKSIDEIDSEMGSKTRNVIKSAQQKGLEFSWSTQTFANDLELFFNLYSNLAKKFSLQIPNKDLLTQMFSAGHLRLARVFLNPKQVHSMALIYLTKTQGYYLYGASSEDAINGSGQLLQLKVIEWLKSQNFNWYDLGGVPNFDPNNGIFRFKKSLGGNLIDLGEEYFQCSSLYLWAQKAKRLIERLKS